MTTNKQVADLLGDPEQRYTRKTKGQFKHWLSYFYRLSNSPERLEAKIKAKIPTAVITDSGDHWAEFSGSAKSGSVKDSHLWVTFTVPEKA